MKAPIVLPSREWQNSSCRLVLYPAPEPTPVVTAARTAPAPEPAPVVHFLYNEICMFELAKQMMYLHIYIYL